MKRHRPLTTAHQRRRLALWALTMLRWIAAVVFADRPVTARQARARCLRVSLDGLTRLVVQLLIVRSAELARRRRRRLRLVKHGRDLKRRHYIRSLLGARLRRVLKAKHVAARIDALIRVLLQLDAYARQLSKRRLTRLWAIQPASAPAALMYGSPSLTPASVDSS